MKLMISTAAVALLAPSAPAFAQYGATAQQAQPATTAQQAPAQQAQAAPGVKPSSKAAAAILALQTAVRSRDAASIPEKVAAAQAVASTKEDRYLIALFQFEAARNANDLTASAAAAEAMANSGVLDASKIALLYLDLGTRQYNAKQFAPAVASFQRAATLTPSDVEAIDMLAAAQAAAGQAAQAAATYQRLIQLRTAAGQKPDLDLYKRAFSAAYEAKSPAAVEIARAWAQAYPGPESWRNAVAIYRNQTKQDVEGTLDLLRLMQATGALNNALDYQLFAEAAADQLNFNEAQSVIDAGIASGIVNPSSPQFRDLVAALKTKQKATAADLEAAVKMSPSALNLLRIGDRFYGMGNYSKAAEVYRQVLSKPGADKDLANLHLGMALARAGDKAGAAAAFGAVSGARADIAKYWLLYVHQQS